MTVEQMRERVGQAYPHPKWQARLREMGDRQIIAIYKHMAEKGQFQPKRKSAWFLPEYRSILRNEHAEQMTMWDILATEGKDKQTDYE